MKGAQNPMRGIYRRGSIYWLARQVDKKRHFVSLETSDPVEALGRAEKIRTEGVLETGAILCHTVERYIRYCRGRGEWTLSTERSKGYVLKSFAKWAGKITPAEVSPEIIHHYYTERVKTHSPRTAHGNLMTLRGLFRWCMEVERTCRDNPAAKLRVKTPSLAAREDFCSPALRDKLISECPRDDLKFVLYCGFHAGLRFNEIVEAKASWFDLNAGLLHLRKHEGIQFKDGEERTIPLTKGFSTFLRTYGLYRPYMVHPEIPTRRKSVYRWDFGRPFDHYMEAQKVPWVTPHIMRHTFASLLASAGVSIYKIAKWLGDDVRTVQRHYAKLLPNDGEIERAFSDFQQTVSRPRSLPCKSASSRQRTHRSRKESDDSLAPAE
jgi:integrase